VSKDQGEINSHNIGNNYFSDIENGAAIRHNILIISRNEKIHTSLRATLQNFFLNGKGIDIYAARDLEEAKSVATQNPDVILVVIDDNIQVNGTYKIFVDYIRKELNNENCYHF